VVETNSSQKSFGDVLMDENSSEWHRRHALLSWTACYQDDCDVHRSEKEGSGWFPQRKKGKKSKRQTEGEVATFFMMEVHEEENEDQSEEAENADNKEDEETIKFVVVETRRTHLVLVTRWWKKIIVCKNGFRYRLLRYYPVKVRPIEKHTSALW
jgi:hypothetical protein